MINLLPQNQKDSLIKDYALRRIIVGLWLLSIVLVSGAVFLAPSYFFSLIEKRNLEKYTASTFGEKDHGGVSTTTASFINRQINELKKPITSNTLYKIVRNLIKNLPSGITLNSIDYRTDKSIKAKKTEKNRGEILLTGSSVSREILSKFVQNLKESGEFIEVIAPVSNFVQDRDINFSITLKYSL